MEHRENGAWGRAAIRVRNALRTKAIGLSRHYRAVFGGDPERGRDAEIVLADLREFCRARQSSFAPDPYVTARNEGRRDVWLRLRYLLDLDEGEVNQLMEIESGL